MDTSHGAESFRDLLLRHRGRTGPTQLGGDAIRTLQLGGLGVTEGQVLLADKQLSGTTDEWADLIARYGGNGLALKVVGESIRRLLAEQMDIRWADCA